MSMLKLDCSASCELQNRCLHDIGPILYRGFGAINHQTTRDPAGNVTKAVLETQTWP